MADSKAKSGLLLDIRNLRIEATVYPPGEAPKNIVLVHDVSLTLEKGKVLGLIGESGAGKSTIGLSSMGYGRGGVRITGGEVILNGRDILKGGKEGFRKLRGREVCYVAQSAAAAFNPAHRLMDQVVEATLLHGTATRAEAEKRAVALFKKLSLPNPETIGERFPHQVSGGQLQRVMTAMALCSEPDLIVFDEPTTALDVTTQIDVLAAIKDAIRDTHVAALYITHDLAVVAQVSDEIMVLRHGRLVEWGGTRQIIKEPRQEYTNALVSVHEIEHAGAEARHDAVPVGQERHRRLWRQPHQGAEERLGRHLSGPDAGRRRRIRLGQVDAGARHHRAAAAEEGTVTFDGRPLANRLADRAEGGSAPAADDLPDGRRGDEPAPDRRHHHRPAARLLFRHARRASATSASPNCSTRSRWARASSTAIRPSFPAARSSASASPARSPPSRS